MLWDRGTPCFGMVGGWGEVWGGHFVKTKLLLHICCMKSKWVRSLTATVCVCRLPCCPGCLRLNQGTTSSMPGLPWRTAWFGITYRSRSLSGQGGTFNTGANTPTETGRHPNPFLTVLVPTKGTNKIGFLDSAGQGGKIWWRQPTNKQTNK